MIAAFNREGIRALLELATPDFLLATAAGFPGGGSFRGRDKVAGYVEEFASNWAGVRYEYEGARVKHGCVVHKVRWVVRDKETGNEVSAEVFGVARFEGDLIAALELFWTKAEATEHARMQGG